MNSFIIIVIRRKSGVHTSPVLQVWRSTAIWISQRGKSEGSLAAELEAGSHRTPSWTSAGLPGLTAKVQGGRLPRTRVSGRCSSTWEAMAAGSSGLQVQCVVCSPANQMCCFASLIPKMSSVGFPPSFSDHTQAGKEGSNFLGLGQLWGL